MHTSMMPTSPSTNVLLRSLIATIAIPSATTMAQQIHGRYLCLHLGSEKRLTAHPEYIVITIPLAAIRFKPVGRRGAALVIHVSRRIGSKNV